MSLKLIQEFHFCRSLSIVLVLDLSALSELLIISDNLMESIKERILKSFSKLSKESQKKVQERYDQRKSKAKDNQWIKPLMVPMIIIGTKYDIFQVEFKLYISLTKTSIQ